MTLVFIPEGEDTPVDKGTVLVAFLEGSSSQTRAEEDTYNVTLDWVTSAFSRADVSDSSYYCYGMEHPDILSDLGIPGLPCFIRAKDGVVEDMVVGVMNEQQLFAWAVTGTVPGETS